MPVAETTPLGAASPNAAVERSSSAIVAQRALRAHGPLSGVDVDPAHRGEVDHQAALGDGLTGNVVPSATDRDLVAARTGG